MPPGTAQATCCANILFLGSCLPRLAPLIHLTLSVGDAGSSSLTPSSSTAVCWRSRWRREGSSGRKEREERGRAWAREREVRHERRDQGRRERRGGRREEEESDSDCRGSKEGGLATLPAVVEAAAAGAKEGWPSRAVTGGSLGPRSAPPSPFFSACCRTPASWHCDRSSQVSECMGGTQVTAVHARERECSAGKREGSRAAELLEREEPQRCRWRREGRGCNDNNDKRALSETVHQQRTGRENRSS